METLKQKGVFYRNKKGNGYVVVQKNGETENIPVTVTYNSDVYDGDTVLVSVVENPRRAVRKATGKPQAETENRNKAIKTGKILEIISRAQTHLIGEYRVVEKKAYLVPDAYIPFRIPVKVTKDGLKCRDGDKIEAAISKYKAVSAMRALPVKNYGDAKTYAANYKSALGGMTHFVEFSREAERQAAGILPKEAKNYVGKRTDLRSKTIFTFTESVFGGNSSGFSIAKGDGMWKVGVHIADVPEYLEEGGKLDAEAAKRGRQIMGSRDGSPMFPASFVNAVCSFGEKREYLSVSVFADFDEHGNSTNVEFCESVIAPALVASAADVDALVSGGDSSALIPLRRKYSPVGEQINLFYELAALLRAARIQKGGADFDACERVFGLDSSRTIKRMSTEYKSDSALMVSEIFIAIGKAAAEKLYYSGAPCLYAGLSEMKADDVSGPPEDRFFLDEEDYFQKGYTQREAAAARGTFYEKRCFEDITTECDAPRLGAKPEFHHAYAAEKYMEFFFPAERYSSLTNLRAIKAFLNEETFDIRKALRGAGNEEKAGGVQKELIKIMTVAYMKESGRNELEGIVLRSSLEGARVLLDCGALGLIAAEDLTTPPFMGKRVKVKVKDADYVTGRIGLVLSD